MQEACRKHCESINVMWEQKSDLNSRLNRNISDLWTLMWTYLARTQKDKTCKRKYALVCEYSHTVYIFYTGESSGFFCQSSHIIIYKLTFCNMFFFVIRQTWSNDNTAGATCPWRSKVSLSLFLLFEILHEICCSKQKSSELFLFQTREKHLL